WASRFPVSHQPAIASKTMLASNRAVPARFLPIASSTAPTAATPIRILEGNNRNATLLESRKNISASSSRSRIASYFLRWADKGREDSPPLSPPAPASFRVVRARLLHERRKPRDPWGSPPRRRRPQR